MSTTARPDPAWANIPEGMWAVLGLLSLRSWTGYEIAQQAPRSINRAWPQRDSSLYAHPPRLVQRGLASVTTEEQGGRKRNRYAITEHGRAALAWWLAQPTGDPDLFVEPFLRLLFADQGSPESARQTLDLFAAWAAANCEAMCEMLDRHLEGEARFPDRDRLNSMNALGHAMLYSSILEWANRFRRLHEADPTLANLDPEDVRREATSLCRAALQGSWAS